MCLCMCIFFRKVISEITRTVSGGTLNPTHSLTFYSEVWELKLLYSMDVLQFTVGAQV